MDKLFYQYLQTHRTDESPSHVSLVHPKGKFLFNEKNLVDFWKTYSEYPGKKGIAEMTSSLTVLPIIIDFDLKKEIDEKDPISSSEERRILYHIKHVQTLVDIYQRVLRDILHNVDERHLICFLLEKNPYYQKYREKTTLKNGFHLHFPFLFLEKTKHEQELLPRIRMELKKLDPQQELPPSYSENSLDRCYLRSPWLLYGSHKEGGDPYKISCALDAKGRIIDDWMNVLEDYILYDCLEQRIRIDMNSIDRLLPQILSIHLCFRKEYLYETRPNLPVISKRHSIINTSFKRVPSMDCVESKDQSHLSELVQRLLSCLSDQRAEQRNEWMHIGWILFNIFQGSECGYQLWLEFSNRSEKFKESLCFYEWNRMQPRRITIGSLKYIANEDNHESYSEIMRDYNKEYLDRCFKLSGAHHDLALVLFQKYEPYFVCASVTHRIWFEFKNHRWIRIDDGYSLRQKISGELVEEYEQLAKQQVSRIRISENDHENENDRLKLIMKMIKNLKTSPFKSHIMKECMEVFYNDHFLSQLDINPYLIAFSNGVYDIQQHMFREGRPMDFISLKMNINYYDHYTSDCKEIKEIEHYFMKIFPDTELREYFLDSAAEIFIGGNFNKVVQIWSGDGDNGKSITQSIFEQMLGPYSVKLPTSLITGKRTQSSAACPELARAGNGVRLAMLQEPDQKDVINIGILKELSGNDTFFARGLYKEGQEINPQFKLVLICNEPPKLTYSDKAAWNRIKMIPFESTFTNEAPDTFEEQMKEKKFPKDLKFRDKIPHMVEPLAFYLLKRLKERPEIRKLPMKVTMATENYKRKNDIYKQFLDESIVYEEGKFCGSTELYLCFRDWQRESCPNQTCPDRNEFLDYIIRLWGPSPTKDGWYDRFIRGPMDHN